MHNTSILRASGAACFAAALAFALPVPDSVRIQFQGTGHPNIASARPRMQSSVTVDVAGERWLLDAGAGAVARLYENGKVPDTLRHIFVSHLHYDHCVDLDAVIWQWRSRERRWAAPEPVGARRARRDALGPLQPRLQGRRARQGLADQSRD